MNPHWAIPIGGTGPICPCIICGMGAMPLAVVVGIGGMPGGMVPGVGSRPGVVYIEGPASVSDFFG